VRARLDSSSAPLETRRPVAPRDRAGRTAPHSRSRLPIWLKSDTRQAAASPLIQRRSPPKLDSPQLPEQRLLHQKHQRIERLLLRRGTRPLPHRQLRQKCRDLHPRRPIRRHRRQKRRKPRGPSAISLLRAPPPPPTRDALIKSCSQSVSPRSLAARGGNPARRWSGLSPRRCSELPPALPTPRPFASPAFSAAGGTKACSTRRVLPADRAALNSHARSARLDPKVNPTRQLSPDAPPRQRPPPSLASPQPA